jgi:myosin heavy subunit
MSKILTGIAVLFMAGAAVLGFLTKGKIGNLKSEVENKATQLSMAKQEAQVAQKDKEAAEKEAQAQKEAAQAAAAELSSAQAALNTAKAQASELEAAVNQKNTEIEDLKKQLAAMPAQGEPAPIAGGGNEERIKELEAQLAAAEDEKRILSEKAASAQAEAAALQKREQDRQAAQMAKGLEGTILAYNPAWNFVVLNIGDKQSVVEGAEMIITRNGQMLGKVKVTSVEPTTSVADVDLASVSDRVRIQPGDKVIYPGS